MCVRMTSKNVKRIISLILVFVLAFSVSVFAYAENDETADNAIYENEEDNSFSIIDSDDSALEENKTEVITTKNVENPLDNSSKGEEYDIYSDEILEDCEPVQNNTVNDDVFDKSLNSETWVKKGNLFNRDNGAEYIVQGFAVGTNYCYSVEMSSDESSHRLYRKNLNNNTNAEIMTSSSPVVSLGHANDMCLVTYKDTNNITHYYLYVIACFKNLSTSYIVKLEYSGSTYEQKAKYNLSAKYSAISKVKYYTNSSGEPMVQFLLRGNDGYYTASVRRGQSGTYSLATTKRFTVSRPSAYTYFANQGIHYESNKLYVPLFGYNDSVQGNNPNQRKKNVVLVYNVSNAVLSSTTVNNLVWNKAVIIQANTSALSHFEIESIGFSVNNPNLNNDLMWFNTNEKNSNGQFISGGIYLDSQDIK